MVYWYNLHPNASRAYVSDRHNRLVQPQDCRALSIDSLDTESVIYAVREAVKECGIPAIINSDQGSQFTSDTYKQLLKELGIRQSMDGKSRWADNIMIERWFRSLKTEQIYPNEYDSPRELRKLVNDYVDTYNSLRPHEALDYKVPDEVFYGCFAA